MVKYLNKGDALYDEAKSRGFKRNVNFTSLRPVIENECETCSSYDIQARVGSTIKYETTTDVLYVSGYGLYVIMEKGVWVDLGNGYNDEKGEQYEIY